MKREEKQRKGLMHIYEVMILVQVLHSYTRCTCYVVYIVYGEAEGLEVVIPSYIQNMLNFERG